MSLNPKSPVPLYHQFRAELERKLENGEWPAGSAIPTEMELVKTYGISRTTVRLALDDLVKAGRIHRQRGRGTFVCQPVRLQPTAPLLSFVDELAGRGLEPSTTVTDCRQVPAPQVVAMTLELPGGSPALYVRRIVSVVGHPVFVEESYFRPELALALPAQAVQVRARPVYELLAAAHILPAEGEQWLEAVTLSEEMARALRVAPESPGLVAARITRSLAGQPLEYSKATYRADHYRYAIHLTQK